MSPPKVKVTISLDIMYIAWLDKEVEKGTFTNRSEGIQHCIEQKMKEAVSP